MLPFLLPINTLSFPPSPTKKVVKFYCCSCSHMSQGKGKMGGWNIPYGKESHSGLQCGNYSSIGNTHKIHFRSSH